jgi:hypothetical protein
MLVKENINNFIKKQNMSKLHESDGLANISAILKPKSPEDVTTEIKRRLAGKNLEIVKETDKYIIYQIKTGKDIQDIVKNFGGKDEDIFYNFYLILDNSTAGEKQILGIKVSPDGAKVIMDAKGHNVEEKYLVRFN